jgi:hypothetical protein
MTDTEPEPLRGDALYQATKRRIAKNNEAAQKRGREQRAARDPAEFRRRAEAERLERSQLPVQPTP